MYWLASNRGYLLTVRLFYTLTADVHTSQDLDVCGRCLSIEERAYRDRLIIASQRHDYVIAHALLRDCLSRELGGAPESFRIERDSSGRPHLASSVDGAAVDFNLSHTQGLVCCVIARGASVGVDAELIDRAHPPLDIATRFFAPTEVEYLTALPFEDRRRKFTELWTLKEAYVKARGCGLSLSLQSFWFHLAEGTDPVFSCAKDCDDPKVWAFFQFAVSEQHVMAAAIRTTSPVAIVAERTTPLARHR
jgi:4'-phosphopantetheinyl transferase